MCLPSKTAQIHEYETSYDFSLEGPQTYSFEPAARRDVHNVDDGQRNLSDGMRCEIERLRCGDVTTYIEVATCTGE